jgi:hypothetical protein
MGNKTNGKSKKGVGRGTVENGTNLWKAAEGESEE